MNANIRPGVCGLCGTAVVQPEAPSLGWTHGHLFGYGDRASHTNYGQHIKKLVLLRVRCMAHKEKNDPRHYDRKGNLVEKSEDIEDGCFLYREIE
jgi:hypothetical protein